MSSDSIKAQTIDLLGEIPTIRRARGYRLYDNGGKRYLDLYQNGGCSLLGHRAGRLSTVLKDTISKGLIFDLPSIYHHRLQRALSEMYPAFETFPLYASSTEALDLISSIKGESFVSGMISDPAKGEYGEVCYDRPFLPPEAHGCTGQVRILLPILPFRIGDAPVVVCLREPDHADRPVQRPLSPVLLAGLLRAIHDLKRFETPPWFKTGFLDGAYGWIQRGPYITPRFDFRIYPEVFDEFRNRGILLSPSPGLPSILPGEASEGEIEKMIRLFKQFPGK